MTLSSFQAELDRLDPTLKITYNQIAGGYQIHQHQGNTRHLVCTVPLGQLGPHVIQAIYNATPHKQGGANVVNDRIDAMIEREQDEEQRQSDSRIRDTVKESWDDIMWRTGSRISIFSPTKDETITITDRRVVHA